MTQGAERSWPWLVSSSKNASVRILVLLPPDAECSYRVDRAGGVEEVPVLAHYSVFLTFQANLEAAFPKGSAGQPWPLAHLASHESHPTLACVYLCVCRLTRTLTWSGNLAVHL